MYRFQNPPDQNVTAHGNSLTKKKDKRSVRRGEEKTLGENNGNNSSRGVSPCDPTSIEEEDDNNWGDENNDDDDWSADVSEEAVNRRMKELTSGIKGLAMDNDLEKTEAARVDIFHEFVKGKLKDGSVCKESKEILTEAERLEIVNKAPIVLCELLFDEAMVSQVNTIRNELVQQILRVLPYISQIKSYKEVFLRFTHDNHKAQKYLMGGFEKSIEAHKTALINKVPIILKTFYDLDIIDEEVILEWAKKVSKKYVGKELSEQIHKKAQPFVTWLKEAEEESSDSDDAEVEFDKGVSRGTNNNNNIIKEAMVDKLGRSDGEDNLDIDEI